MDFANPTFEQMARHWFDSFCTNPRVRFSELIFLSVLALLVAWSLVFQRSFGNGVGD
jgi:hypothetical protein